MQTTPETTEKAARIRLLIMDVDGVLTDGTVLFAGSTEGVLFNVQDGTGIKYLQRGGIATALITGRDVPAVRARAENLGIEHIAQNAKVKLDAYHRIRERAGVDDAHVGYIGDDLPDIPVMRQVGLAIAVPNAVAEVLERADAVTERPGGRGAVREAAEFILKSQGKWESILERYLRTEERNEPT